MNLIWHLIVSIFVVNAQSQIGTHVLESVREIALKSFTSGTLVVSGSLIMGDSSCSLFRLIKSGRDEILTCAKSDILQFMLQDFHEMATWPIILLPENENSLVETRSDIGTYILVSSFNQNHQVVTDITRQLQLLTNNKMWNPRARFLVILTQERLSGEELAANITSIMWRKQIINVAVLVPAQGNILENSTTPLLEVRAWFPYGEPGRCGNVSDSVLLDQWVIDTKNKRRRFFYNVTLFPNKIPTDFLGCPVLVGAFEFAPNIILKKGIPLNSTHLEIEDGHEYRLLMTLMKYVNLTAEFRYNVDQWGWYLNGSWYGVTGEIIRGERVTAPVDFWNKCNLIPELECTVSFIVDHIKWWVPCAQPYPKWTAMTRVFQPSLWATFLLAYVSLAICMSIVVTLNYKLDVNTESQHNQSYTSLMKCLLNFWAVILEESASNNPPHMPAVRIMFLSWVLYCWAANTVYQSFLTSFMVDPGLQHQLSSPEEVLASDIDIGLLKPLVTLFPELSDKKYRSSTSCENNTECHLRVAHGGNLAIMFSEVSMDYLIASKYVTKENKPMICTFDYVVCAQPVILPFMKGYPLVPLFDKVILHILDSGLLDFWLKEIMYLSTLEALKDSETVDGEYVKFSLEHLESAYGFLFLGYIIASFSFLGELLHFHHSKKRKSRVIKKK